MNKRAWAGKIIVMNINEIARSFASAGPATLLINNVRQ